MFDGGQGDCHTAGYSDEASADANYFEAHSNGQQASYGDDFESSTFEGYPHYGSENVAIIEDGGVIMGSVGGGCAGPNSHEWPSYYEGEDGSDAARSQYYGYENRY